MPSQFGPADTIRILVATDNHVGAHERDAERENDSWRSFEEVLTIARERDVDMVLLAGDLFHDNNEEPSRQAMYQVMRILRSNCLGNKPCELQFVSDKTEAFEGSFDHVNYEDPDINVSLPVFSIHGNHDDPSGTKMLASLDLLQMTGLVNYYGRTPESDNIHIKPLLLQKGRTKLALYGMSNVRDERLYRSFRDGKVRFYRPGLQQSDWFNIFSVHQNHYARTEKGYLPEEFIPSFMDLVVWGHEHECKIDPLFNPEMGFHVMQPGSSVATSLVQGETVAKHVAIVNVVGRRFEVEPIRLKTVRPFVMREIVLMDDPVAKKVVKKENNRADLTRRLTDIVNEMIEQAKSEWLENQDDSKGLTKNDSPKPLIRLRVEYTAPEGSKFDLENPQRFSNRFQEQIANRDDVVQFHRRKRAATLKTSTAAVPQSSGNEDLTLSTAQVEKLVKQFLEAQSLAILPQNSFGDAVAQFVDKDDKHAMEMFVAESLKSQVEHLLQLGDDDDDREQISKELKHNKSKLEELFAAGHLKKARRSNLKPKPDNWDSDIDGAWEDQPGAIIWSDLEDGDQNEEPESKPKAAAKGKTKAATKPAATKKVTTKTTGGRNKTKPDDEDDEVDDIMIIDDDEEDEESPLFVRAEPTPPPAPAATKGRRAATAATSQRSTASKPATTQASTRTSARRTTRNTTTATASQSQQSSIAGWARGNSARGGSASFKSQTKEEPEEISDGDDDDDAFEPMKPPARRR